MTKPKQHNTDMDQHITGANTMSSSMKSASSYHSYIFNNMAPWIRERVFEVGTGYGQYTEKMIKLGKTVLAADIDPGLLTQLSIKLDSYSPKSETMTFDLEHPDEYADKLKNFKPDTILCINVLEHIRDDSSALTFLSQNSPDDCILLIMVPALSGIFNRLDTEAGHHRRYNKKALIELYTNSGWKITDIRYINTLGVFGWILAGWFSRNKKNASIDSKETNGLIRLFDSYLLPLAKVTDLLCRHFCGLSLVVRAIKV